MPTPLISRYDSEFEIVYSEIISNAALMIVHKQIFAVTFHIEGLLTLPKRNLSKLNILISEAFPNSYCYLIFHNYKILLKIGNNDFIDITDDSQITIQGRCWEDYCLKLINLSQNYRWEKSYNYN